MTGERRERTPGEWATTGGYRHLAAAVLYREFVLFVRYPFDAAGLLVVQLTIFAILLVGGRAVAPAAMADTLAGIVVGYFLWTMATAAYAGVATDVRMEAQWGTLERHVTTPFGFGAVMLLKAAAKLLFSAVVGSLVLAAMLLATGTTLRVDVVTVVPVVALALSSVLGVGFAMAGLSVLYKRVGNWAGMLQFAFVGLVSAPAFDLGWARWLPLAQGSALLQRAMTGGVRLWEFEPVALGVLVATGVGYLAAGYLAFQVAQRRARRLGVLGHY